MLSGKNLYLKIDVGENLKHLLRPGRICTKDGKCGWLVVRKRRNKYYVYLQGRKGEKDVYLGPLDEFSPRPVQLTIDYNMDRIVIDINYLPETAEDIVGVVRGLKVLVDNGSRLVGLLYYVLVKYGLLGDGL